MQAYGNLDLVSDRPTLADLEEFCREARRFGLQDDAPAKIKHGDTPYLRFVIDVVPAHMAAPMDSPRE